MITKPSEKEYLPYYAHYVQLVDELPIIDVLEEQRKELSTFISKIDVAKADYRYASNKWSLKEVFLHIAEVERVMAYRALRFSRKDQTDLPGFDENEFIKNFNSEKLSLSDVAQEIDIVRQSTILLFRQFDDATSQLTGTANFALVSVRALAYIIAGHAKHHLSVIEERYL